MIELEAFFEFVLTVDQVLEFFEDLVPTEVLERGAEKLTHLKRLHGCREFEEIAAHCVPKDTEYNSD